MLISVNNMGKPYQCDQCEKTFNYRSQLQTHMRRHTGEKPFKCNSCSRCFTHRSNFQLHILSHSGEKPFKCNYCEKSFNNKQNLLTHMVIHTGEKTFKCNYCEKSFSTKQNSLRHMLIHTGEKNYQCKQCGKSFNLQQNYQRHLKSTIHYKKVNQSSNEVIDYKSYQYNRHDNEDIDKELTFQCNHCRKYFATRLILTNHMVIHTGEKPYQCKQCEKSFSFKGNYLRHMKSSRHYKKNTQSSNKFIEEIITRTYQCNSCDITLKKKSNFLLHLRSKKHLENRLCSSNTKLIKKNSKNIDFSKYNHTEDFVKKVSLNNNECVNYEPTEECVRCHEKFDISQVTILLNLPLRTRIICSKCKFVVYTIICNLSHPLASFL